jgi:hypothetical protein
MCLALPTLQELLTQWIVGIGFPGRLHRRGAVGAAENVGFAAPYPHGGLARRWLPLRDVRTTP